MHPFARLITAWFVWVTLSAGPAAAADLATQYPATLDFSPKSLGYEWKCEANDVWRLKHFKVSLGEKFRIELGSSQVVMGRHQTNVLWAAVFPKETGQIIHADVGRGEQITSVWLRFHPARVGELFPAETVSGHGDPGMVERARLVAEFKIHASYHVGRRATVPRRNHTVVDCETTSGLRRFYAIDSVKETVEYVDFFRTRTLPVTTPLTEGGAVEIFDKVWHSFDREYAMFVVKPNVDWRKLRDEYRPRAAAAKDNRELGRTISRMLDHLEDLHVYVKVDGEQLRGYNRERPLNASRDAVEHLIGRLKDQKWNTTWTRAKDGIGYINVYGLQDDELPQQIEAILRGMEDTRGLIVDLRFNGGGSEPLAQQVAGYFVDRERVYAMSQYRAGPNHDELTKK